MPCRLTILASGSSGNCTYIETDKTRILVDAGVSARQIEEKLNAIGCSASRLHAILLTHEHNDHIQGLRVLSSRFKIPIYCNRMTREASLDSFASAGVKLTPLEWRVFENGSAFAAGDFDIESFSIPHDAVDPVGFLIHHGDKTICFMTDLGHVNQMILSKARRATTLLLETNYDLKLLQDHPHRPWSLKQRISGRHGHLSNDEAAAALGEIMNERLQHVYLSHISQDCNRPEIAEKTILSKLKALGAAHVRVTVTNQYVACPTEYFESAPSPKFFQPTLFDLPQNYINNRAV
jgi:phosphoribosyl 1,2-cyclic phosphodiesterase